MDIFHTEVLSIAASPDDFQGLSRDWLLKSSAQDRFFKKSCSENFTKFTGIHFYQSFLIKLLAVYEFFLIKFQAVYLQLNWKDTLWKTGQKQVLAVFIFLNFQVETILICS